MTVGFIGGKFLPFHQGHVYVILEASNRVDELYVVLSHSEKRDRELCARDGVKYMPPAIRLSWIGRNLANLENIKVIDVKDDHWDSDYDWEEGANAIKRAIGKPIDVVFSSENSYGEHFRKHYPTSRHEVVDDKRKTVTISATEMRRDLYGNWDKLPASVRSFFTKRVGIVGTESTGKSTLAQKLTRFYNTAMVHEVGRDYCARYANQLTVPMFDRIAMEHALLTERRAEESDRVLLVDSDAVITQYYLGMYFNGVRSPLIEEIARTQQFDLLLYLDPDVPWVADGLRFAGDPAVRAANDERLRHMYDERGFRYLRIGGNFQERFTRAKAAIDDLFVKP